MWFGVISLFPAMFEALNAGITGKAIKNQIVKIEYWNPRDFATDKHQCVDDHPYGGGPGMLMMSHPLRAAIHAAKKAVGNKPHVIYLSPQGRLFNQAMANELSTKKSVILVAGRYEGIDERIIQQEIDEEWSIGNYILTGGELAAMIVMDTTIRLLPDVVGDQNSVLQDSLANGLLKYPQYTRPAILSDAKVPAVLLSGHHQAIKTWRLKMSLGNTWLKRPDLLAEKWLTAQELILLNEFISDFLKARPFCKPAEDA